MKLDTLCELFKMVTITQVVIYCNTWRKLDFLQDQLSKRDFTVSMMHAGLGQKERDLAMREFHSGSSRVLISTDSPARGINVNLVSLAINYDFPSTVDNYMRRIGRTRTKFGRNGVAINVVAKNEVEIMKDIERHYNTHIEEMPMDIADMI